MEVIRNTIESFTANLLVGYSLDDANIEVINQTFETVFHTISKHLELRQKYSDSSHIFNYLLGVWKSNETLTRLLINIKTKE